MRTSKKDKFEGKGSRGPKRSSSRDGDYEQYKRKPRFNRRDSRRGPRAEMHKAVCDKCGEEC